MLLSEKSEENKKAALEEFMKNEYWREKYENAPTERMKEYLNLKFCLEFPEYKNDEIINRRKELYDNELEIRDIEYLIKDSYGMMRGRYLAKIEELKKKRKKS